MTAPSIRRRLRLFGRREHGSTMVEFAIVTGVVSLLLLGMIEFSLVFWQKSMVTGAARLGTRYAIVRSSQSGRPADTASVSAYVRSRTELTPIVVTTTWPTTNDPGEFVNVKVTYQHKLASGIMSAFLAQSVVLASTSRMVIVF